MSTSVTATSAGSSAAAPLKYAYTQAPDASFYAAFEAAYAQQKAAPAAAGGASATSVSVSPVGQAMGRLFNESVQRRQVSEADQSAFADILHKAYVGNGMQDPQAFLQTLSPQELGVLQRIHNLADPIQPAGLGAEGAANLLLPTGYKIDMDDDGMYDVGAGTIIAFPPPGAPQSFLQAWEAATDGMDEGEKMSHGLSLHLAMNPGALSLNGPQSGMHADFTDPASYAKAVDTILVGLELARGHNPPEVYEKSKDFWTRLQGLLA